MSTLKFRGAVAASSAVLFVLAYDVIRERAFWFLPVLSAALIYFVAVITLDAEDN